MNVNVKLLCQMIISLAIIGPFWYIAHEIIFHGSQIDPTVREIAGVLISNVVPLVTGIAGFWIGSSLSSASKDHDIARAIEEKSNASSTP